MAGARRRLVWRIAPAVGLVVAFAALSIAGRGLLPAPFDVLFSLLELAVLMGAVFASVHHADVIAHRTGEPYGTLVLTVAVTVIEVALILSIMLAGDGSPTLARDTVFSVVMVVCNGLVGLSLIVGGLRYGEQEFRTPGASAYLVVLMPLATLALILPNYTTSAAGPFYSATQLTFVSLVTLALYGVFLYVQTVRHRDYFLSDAATSPDEAVSGTPTTRQVWESIVLLVVALAAVVLLAKSFAGSVGSTMEALGAPIGAVGLLVALLVLLPETMAALRAARRNEIQKSLNLALGSSLATIGLTIPAVSILSLIIDRPLALGLELRDSITLMLTFAVSLVTFGGGRTNILPGFVHLVLFANFVFLIFAP
jgi:Ca2+:H+ antiporter